MSSLKKLLLKPERHQLKCVEQGASLVPCATMKETGKSNRKSATVTDQANSNCSQVQRSNGFLIDSNLCAQHWRQHAVVED